MGGLPVANSEARSFSAVSVFSLGLSRSRRISRRRDSTRERGRDGDAPDAHAMVAGRCAAAGGIQWRLRWDQVFIFYKTSAHLNRDVSRNQLCIINQPK